MTDTTPVVDGVTLIGELGRGGTSTVHLGIDDATGHRVAVKVVSAGDDRTRTAATGFGVSDDSLVRLFRTGRTTAGDTCLVMEFCPGGTVADQVAARGPFDLGEVVCVLHGLVDALSALHGAGLVHADVSPSNILFTGLGRPLLGDLDVVGRSGEPMPSRITEGYVDEAQTTLTPAVDVYALGAMGWFLLTGEAPGPQSDRLPLPALRRDTPVALADLIVSCLGPVTRRPTVDEVAARLADLGVTPEPVRLRPVPTTPDRAVVITARRRPAAAVRDAHERVAAAAARVRRDAERTSRRRRRRAVTLVLVGSAAGLGAVWAVTRPSTSTAQTPPPAAATSSAPSATPDPVAALTELNHRRVDATMRLDAAALAGVDAPASPALRHDQALIGSFRRRGLRPDGLQVSILWTTVRRTTATRSEILVSSVVEPYRLERADGSLLRTVPQGAVVTDVVTLTRTAGAWRVLSVTDS